MEIGIKVLELFIQQVPKLIRKGQYLTHSHQNLRQPKHNPSQPRLDKTLNPPHILPSLKLSHHSLQPQFNVGHYRLKHQRNQDVSYLERCFGVAAVLFVCAEFAAFEVVEGLSIRRPIPSQIQRLNSQLHRQNCFWYIVAQ